MAYVPPALRRKREAALKGKDERSNESPRQQSSDSSATHDLRSLKDIQKHFWPNWVPETSSWGRESQDPPVDADNPACEPDQHGDAVVDGSASIVKQEGTGKQPQTTPLELDHSTKVDVQADIQSDAPQQAQQAAQHVSGEVKKSSAPAVQQLEDSPHSKGESASDRNKLLSTDSNDDTAKRSLDTATTNPPALDTVHPHNTLNSTEQSSDSLQYVLLFYDANPRWRSDQIIYVKSALELLPTSKQDDKAQTQSTPQEPLANNIMVFEQQNGHRTPTSAMFKFIGYYNLTKMQILEPQTPELVKMQEQKWTRVDKHGRAKPINRNAEGWKKSLSQRWAVLGFERVEKATEELKPPQIEKPSRRDTNDDTKEEGRSVNDMLREMRLKDGSRCEHTKTEA